MLNIVDVVLAQDLWESVKDNVKNSSVVNSITKDVAGFVEAVLANPRSKKITALRIWGHGYIDRPEGNAIFGSDVLSADTVEKHRPALARLTSCFANPARTELRGCAAAKGNGAEMMKTLADLWRVSVYASDKYQHLVTMWQPPVYVASPGVKTISPTTGIEVGEAR